MIHKWKDNYRLVYLMLLVKMFIFYWLTGVLDMMDVIEVPLLTALFLLTVFEACSCKESRPRRYIFYGLYTFITLVMLADAAYSSYFGEYASVNQLYQLASLRQITADGNVIGAAVSPLCLLTLLDYPFVLYWYRKRNEGKTGMIDEFVDRMNESGKSTESRKAFANSAFSLIAHMVLYITAICCFYYYGFNPQELRSVQKVNHIEIFTYHTNDILVNVVGRMKREKVDEEQIKQVMKELVPASSGDDYHGVAKGRNLILIQTESLNDFVIGAEYNGQEITPFLNRLLRKDTLYFNHFYSTTGVGNTCDAEFTVLNSLYPNEIMECYRMYVDDTFNGLPWMLRSQGYETMAFHGYIKTFWNRNEAYKNQGIQEYYSQERLESTQVSGFGITDKEMFRQATDILAKKKQPFFSFMITLTNHIPYELDPTLASLEVAPEDTGSTFGNYLQTVRYTDESFEDLFRYLKEKGMYDNSIIVIYGDHQGLNMETQAVKEKMTSYLGKEYNFDEMLNVPFIIHIPGLNEARTVDTVGGQIDVMPTIANLMDLDYGQPYVFGHDLLNADEGYVAQISYIGKGSFITGDGNRIFAIGRDGTVENGQMISLFDGSPRNLDVSYAQTMSDRANLLIDTCMEVLDYNLIGNYVTH